MTTGSSVKFYSLVFLILCVIGVIIYVIVLTYKKRCALPEPTSCPKQKDCPISPKPEPQKISDLNESCIDNPCRNGLVCYKYICKIPLSEECISSSDCYGDNSICRNNICVINTPDDIKPSQKPSEFGDDCSRTPCMYGLVCDSRLNICLKPEGSSCFSDNECANDHVCMNGVCSIQQPEPQPSKNNFCIAGSICSSGICGKPVLTNYNTVLRSNIIMDELPTNFVCSRLININNSIVAVGFKGDVELPVVKELSETSIVMNNKITNHVYIYINKKWIEINLQHTKLDLIPVDISSDNKYFYILCNKRIDEPSGFTTTDHAYRNKRVADETVYGKTDDYTYKSYILRCYINTDDIDVSFLADNSVYTSSIDINTVKNNTSTKKSKKSSNKDNNTVEDWREYLNSTKQPIITEEKDVLSEYITNSKKSKENLYIKLSNKEEWIVSMDTRNKHHMLVSNLGKLYMYDGSSTESKDQKIHSITTDIKNIRYVRFTDKSLYIVSRETISTTRTRTHLKDTVYIYNYRQLHTITNITTYKKLDPFVKTCDTVKELERTLTEIAFTNKHFKPMKEEMDIKELFNDNDITSIKYVVNVSDNKSDAKICRDGRFSVIVNDITTTDITSSIIITIWDEYKQRNYTFNIIVNPTSYDDYYLLEMNNQKLSQYSRHTIVGSSIVSVLYRCVDE